MAQANRSLFPRNKLAKRHYEAIALAMPSQQNSQQKFKTERPVNRAFPLNETQEQNSWQ
jgi:hypothetical protein